MQFAASTHSLELMSFSAAGSSSEKKALKKAGKDPFPLLHLFGMKNKSDIKRLKGMIFYPNEEEVAAKAPLGISQSCIISRRTFDLVLC